jgi:ATP-binding cassette, subfamily B, bacterial
MISGGQSFGLHWMGYGDREGPKVKFTRDRIWRVLQYLKPYWPYSAAVLGCIAVATALGIVPPLLIRMLIDTAIPQADGGLLNLLVLGMIAFPIGAGLIGVLQQYLNTMVGQSIMSDLRHQLFQHLQRQSLRFYTVTPTGQIMSRVTNDVAGVQNVVTGTLSTIVSNAITVLFTLIIIFVLHWQLALIAIITVPIILLPTRQVGRYRNQVSRETQEKQAEVTAYLQERLSISGYVLSRIFGRQRDELQWFGSLNRDLMKLHIRSAMVGRWFFMFVAVLATAGPALVYWYGGHQAIAGTLTLGTLIAFVAYLGNLYRPVGQLANIYVDLQGAMAVFDRIFEALDLVPDVQETRNATVLPAAKGRIVFEDVSFTYPAPPPGRDGNASGAPGDRLAIRSFGGYGGGGFQGGFAGGPQMGMGGRGERRGGRSWSNGPLGTVAPAGDDEDAAGTTPAAPLRPALSGVSFAIEPGQLAALVGPSGAGKTTVTYLIPRFYDPDQGRVTLDGHDLKDVTLDSLAAQIGIVTQESFLFHATIRENLLHARPDATEEQLVAACKAANIHDFIVSLPQGYDTVVGERGFRLSGGEKQRVSIARAILKDPRILILDEATSSLDSTSEALIQDALEPLMKGRTSVVIAHRLSTILAADKILVMDGGRLVEEGTHEQLLARGGVYATLYRIQFRQKGERPLRRVAGSKGQAAWGDD